MPSLQVRDLPDRIFFKLRRQAEREHRSLAQEAVALLEKGLGISDNATERRKKLLLQIKTAAEFRKYDSLKPPAKLIREDRER